MTFRTLIVRSLRFHWRAHLGVLLGATVGSAALIGALVVGDSVRESLRERALQRLGNAQVVLSAGDRLFRAQLASDLTRYLFVFTNELRAEGLKPIMPQVVAAVMQLPGTASTPNGAARANGVRVYGVDNQFWQLASRAPPLSDIPRDMVVLNAPLAEQLRVKPGDSVLFRIVKPSLLSHDTPIAPQEAARLAMRLRVHAVVLDEQLGQFSLQAGSAPPLNAFVSLTQFQEILKEPYRANMLLTPPASRLERRLGFQLRDFARSTLRQYVSPTMASGLRLYQVGEVPTAQAVAMLKDGLRTEWSLQDAGLLLQLLPNQNAVELRSSRVFLDGVVESIILAKALPPRVLEKERRLDFEQSPLIASNTQPLLTYLANLLRAGTNATPYSMVTAAGPPWTPVDLRDDEILVSPWLAEDLQVKPGDAVEMTYFLPESGARLTEATNRFRVRAIVPMEMPWADRTLMPEFPGLEKAESTADWDTAFPLVHKIRPQDEQYWKQYRGTPKAFVTLAAGQKMWGNRFGNLTAIRFPVPTNATGPLTPALSPGGGEGARRAGEGEIAKVEPTGTGRISAEVYRAAIEKKILATLKPEDVGLRFEPVREQALKAAEQSQDFGGLFLGFSFFLIAAALLLMALLFQLGVEQRATEIGTLLALGFRPKQVRRLLLGEGVALALIGSVVGALGGCGYAQAMLHGLATIWRDAVGASALQFHATAQSIGIGIVASVAAAGLAIWLTLRRFVHLPPRVLLAGGLECGDSSLLSAGDSSPSNSQGQTHWMKRILAGGHRTARPTSRPGRQSGDKSPHSKVGWLALAAAVGLVAWMFVRGDTANAGVFFGAGALLLVAGLAAAAAVLARLGGAPGIVRPGGTDVRRSDPAGRRDAGPTLGRLALSGATRRRTRSLATAGLLACGSFLIVAIGVFRLDANRDATRRASGTGGFSLIGEATMPVVQDLNTKSGREAFGLGETELAGVSVVPFRVRDGDDASCLNLNRAQKPRLLGVKPELLEKRFTFAKGSGWSNLISTRLQPGEPAPHDTGNRLSGFSAAQTADTGLKTGAKEIEIPAVGDLNSILWAMGKKVGDTVDYTDERGRPFKVRLVGAVANSILQGSLIIDEAEFVKRFPSESGYRYFLIDAQTNTTAAVSATLSRALQDDGLELTPAARRLAQFNAVQNTYLGTFQVLGGLGLLLGSAGLGVVVLRNVLERRGELAVLVAVGFRRRALQRLVLLEHGALLALGLGVGIVSAAVAVLPSLLSPGTHLPWASLALTLAAVLANGALWTWLATRHALRGNLLAALRNE